MADKLRSARDVAHERMRGFGSCTRTDDENDRYHSDECDEETVWVASMRAEGAEWMRERAKSAVAQKSRWASWAFDQFIDAIDVGEMDKP